MVADPIYLGFYSWGAPVVLSAPGAVITFNHICQLYRTDISVLGPAMLTGHTVQ